MRENPPKIQVRPLFWHPPTSAKAQGQRPQSPSVQAYLDTPGHPLKSQGLPWPGFFQISCRTGAVPRSIQTIQVQRTKQK